MKTNSGTKQPRKSTSATLKRLFRRLGFRRPDDARQYVGTDPVSGQLQLELLKREGCKPDSKVLEIGCGRLHLGIPLIQYLQNNNYVGIDPNEWLRQAALREDRYSQLVADKGAVFLSGDSFDASELGIQFDFIFSHSVLSHAAHWQLEQFLQNSAAVMAPAGRLLSSIRLAEGNEYGSQGTPDRKDSMDEEWQYPGNSYFTLATVVKTAGKFGLEATHVPEYTEFYTKTRPKEFHDWIVCSFKTIR